MLDLALSGIDTGKPIIIFTIASLYTIKYQTFDTAVDDTIIEYNRNIYILAQNHAHIKIVDIGDFYKKYSEEQLIDWKYYYLSHMPVNPKLASAFSQWFHRQVEITEMKRKKCIVLDLDNTLWGGVLGEDGIDGIKMGEDYPGSAFRFFQSYMLELEHTGIMLAVCSKNNENDVMNVWEKHPDTLLRKDDFVTYRINWNNKADNIRDMARELNIGLDSMVFIDDNPAERELIKQMLPQVAAPDFPARPYLYPDFCSTLTDTYFSTYRLTEEDVSKTQQYKENTEREHYKEQFADMNAYLRSLEIELTVEQLNTFNIARFSQMTQKTNQFNLTTCRYTETEIQSLGDKGSWVYGLRVKDRFGDAGLTGLLIIEITGQTANINTFLLSCRILGKDIEYAFITYMLIKLKASGFTRVTASFIKSAKNEQVERFYEKRGFTVTKSSGNRKEYALALDRTELLLSDIYRIEEQ